MYSTTQNIDFFFYSMPLIISQVNPPLLERVSGYVVKSQPTKFRAL